MKQYTDAEFNAEFLRLIKPACYEKEYEEIVRDIDKIKPRRFGDTPEEAVDLFTM